MRIYDNCLDMMGETARDLYEMGCMRRTATVQDIQLAGEIEYDTKELMNYSFCLKRWRDAGQLFSAYPQSSRQVVSEWASAEFQERISQVYMNPGKAWTFRHNVWAPFMERNRGKFSYTYNERIRLQLRQVITELRKHPTTRQAILSIWDAHVDIAKLGVDRVPCSIFYHFISETDREGNIIGLNMIYHMRSSDFVTHFGCDVRLALYMLEHVAGLVQLPVGRFLMNISSLHYFRKDENLLLDILGGRAYMDSMAGSQK